jgi:hypothetical protein
MLVAAISSPALAICLASAPSLGLPWSLPADGSSGVSTDTDLWLAVESSVGIDVRLDGSPEPLPVLNRLDNAVRIDLPELSARSPHRIDIVLANAAGLRRLTSNGEPAPERAEHTIRLLTGDGTLAQGPPLPDRLPAYPDIEWRVLPRLSWVLPSRLYVRLFDRFYQRARLGLEYLPMECWGFQLDCDDIREGGRDAPKAHWIPLPQRDDIAAWRFEDRLYAGSCVPPRKDIRPSERAGFRDLLVPIDRAGHEGTGVPVVVASRWTGAAVALLAVPAAGVLALVSIWRRRRRARRLRAG